MKFIHVFDLVRKKESTKLEKKKKTSLKSLKLNHGTYRKNQMWLETYKEWHNFETPSVIDFFNKTLCSVRERRSRMIDCKKRWFDGRKRQEAAERLNRLSGFQFNSMRQAVVVFKRRGSKFDGFLMDCARKSQYIVVAVVEL